MWYNEIRSSQGRGLDAQGWLSANVTALQYWQFEIEKMNNQRSYERMSKIRKMNFLSRRNNIGN